MKLLSSDESLISNVCIIFNVCIVISCLYSHLMSVLSSVDLRVNAIHILAVAAVARGSGMGPIRSTREETLAGSAPLP